MRQRIKNTLIFTDTDNGGIIHIANIKGGVGKSTVATNLASSFSRRAPTLLIDLDVQGSATVALGQDVDQLKKSSWELFRHRFSSDNSNTDSENLFSKSTNYISKIEAAVFKQIIGHGSITSIAVKVQPCLDLIPAGPELFKTPSSFQINNLLYNLKICREYYKYIIIDTPSVWNSITKRLYLYSDLNLVPVTLNALSTKSLRDYLTNVRSLAEHNRSIRIRIVKNEVFGKQNSKNTGKTRTMNENRKFLDNLCEQVAFESSSGVSLLPQSIMFDLEIPESSVVRNAQDEGKPVHDYQQYGVATKAFDELASKVQFVLNTPFKSPQKNIWYLEYGSIVFKAAAVLIILLIVGQNNVVSESESPRPLAPQQLATPIGGVFSYTFNNGESLYKLAKYAICRFRARVPSMEDVSNYVKEIVEIHNMTRLGSEQKISTYESIPKGLKVTFYPPMSITNPSEKQLVPVYLYFMGVVDDKLSYVTGDWCERGTGGGQPHYGIDIAAKLGSKIISPIDGEVVTLDNATAGHTLGILKDGNVLYFCHMDKRFFKDGDKVKQGQVVGTVGLTGHTSGPHVHVGYGIRSQSQGEMVFRKYRYKITDPKLFFYRKFYLDGFSKKLI
jgi:cellulose biosynthesis protein BcsQ